MLKLCPSYGTWTFPVNIIPNQSTGFTVLVLATSPQKTKNRVTLKDQNIVLYPPVKLFLDVLKPVRIHQPAHPEDGIEGEPPDVSHTVKDRNKAVRRQLNYTWLPTPAGKNLKGIISLTTLKSCSVVGFTNLPKQFFCLPTPFVQHFEGQGSPHKFSPASVRAGGKHITPLSQDTPAWRGWKRGTYPSC